jgi:tetratricopeptide (TPR) repeat protein
MAKKRKAKSAPTRASVPATPKREETANAPVPTPSSFGNPGFFADRRNAYFIGALVLGCLVLYGQTLSYGFNIIDDNGYVFENSAVLGGLSWGSVKWAFTTYSQANWHPVTWISLLLDTSVFGPRPGTYHLVNVIFHTLNSIGVYLVLKELTGSVWRSALVAAIFAFHPTHVESVAWIAERKDVLSTFFWLLATYYYIRYVRLKSAVSGDGVADPSTKRRTFYAVSVIAMALGIMAKPMVVTLPFTLLLLDYWPLGRIEEFRLDRFLTLTLEKAPFFALSVISSVFTVLAQARGGAVVSLMALPFHTRALNALVACAKYVVMMFYPAGLGLSYPYNLTLPGWQIGLAALLVGGVTVACLLTIRTKKYLFVGWFWFLGTLVPVIGLIQVGAQSMADRYTYVPYIGLGLLVVWLAADLLTGLDRRLVAATATAFLVIFCVITFRQVQLWRSNEALLLHTIAVTQRNGFMEQSLCMHYMSQNRLDEAAASCQRSIEYAPTPTTARKLMGMIRFRQGRPDQAAAYFLEALQLRPDQPDVFTDFVGSQLQPNNLDQVAALVAHFATAAAGPTASSDPTFRGFITQTASESYKLVGWAYSQQNRYDAAAANYGKALESNGSDAELRSNYGFMLYRAGRTQDGIQQVKEAIRQRPEDPASHNMLGTILSAEGQRDEAIKEFEKALELKPDYTMARNNLEKLRARG